MLSLSIPTIFSNVWFWLAIVAVIIVIHYFFGKAPQPCKINPFFKKHKQSIKRTMDIFLIFVILLGWVPFLYLSISTSVESILKYTHISNHILVTGPISVFAIGATALSGGSGVLIGLLSVFESNLTKNKRLILSVVSVLPVCFITLALLTTRFDNPESKWTLVKIGLGSLALCWLFNGSAIITGKHIIRVSWLLMRKLKLVSGEFPE
jgi:hypothetical protein